MAKLIAGNWKMNPPNLEAATRLAAAVRSGAGGVGAKLLICPPFTALAGVGAALRGSEVLLGGQDCHARAYGAHTGDIAPEMLRDLGVSHVILGHSERRADHGETDAVVQAKVRAASAAGLTPLVCVGETEDERRDGQQHDIVGRQLHYSLPDGFGGIVAYEPIWAIGTGRTPTETDVAAMHLFIHAELRARFSATVPILYGGSVKPANAAALLALPHVDGALVGGASLDAADFLAIAAS